MKIVYETEIYHYGVPGMRWGIRKDQEARYDEVGFKKGKAKYLREKADEASEENFKKAKEYEDKADELEARGDRFGAYSARKASEMYELLGFKDRAAFDREAEALEKEALKKLEEADEFDRKSFTQIGKKEAATIINEALNAGYQREKDRETKMNADKSNRERYNQKVKDWEDSMGSPYPFGDYDPKWKY